MADLKYNTEKLRATALKYREIAGELKSLKETLSKQIEDLKDIHWKSEAGKKFQEVYKEGWADNVNKYVGVLEEMATQIEYAANEYDLVTVKLKSIEGISV